MVLGAAAWRLCWTVSLWQPSDEICDEKGKPTDQRVLLSSLRIKVFLYVLLRDIEFSVDPGLVIEKKVKCVHASS